MGILLYLHNFIWVNVTLPPAVHTHTPLHENRPKHQRKHKTPTYCILAMLLPIPLHPPLELPVHCLQFKKLG